MTHICGSKLSIIGSDNGLSPGRRQAINWTNAGILLIWPLGTNFSEISIEINIFSFKKMHLKMSSGKCRLLCLSLNVSTFKGCWKWACCPVISVSTILMFCLQMSYSDLTVGVKRYGIATIWYVSRNRSHDTTTIRYTGWETSARLHTKASENLAGRVENRPGRVEFCIGYIRDYPVRASAKKFLVSQPDTYNICYFLIYLNF